MAYYFFFYHSTFQNVDVYCLHLIRTLFWTYSRPRAYLSPPPTALLSAETPGPHHSKLKYYQGFKLRLNLLLNIYYLDHIFAMASTVELASSFIEGAPPGEVCTSTMIQEPHSLGHRPL
jgi:hypothetical protein